MNKFMFVSFAFVLSFVLLGNTSPVQAGYGDAGVAPVCSNEKPGKPWLYALTASGKSQASLYVDKSDRANSWTVAYGVQSGKYIYGLTNFGRGNERIIEINDLPAGTYYFAIRGNNGCMPGPFSNEMSVRMGGGGRLVSANYTPPAGEYTPPTTKKITNPTISKSPVAPSVAPKAVVPIKGTAPTNGVGFWQSISNFFRGLFGGK